MLVDRRGDREGLDEEGSLRNGRAAHERHGQGPELAGAGGACGAPVQLAVVVFGVNTSPGLGARQVLGSVDGFSYSTWSPAFPQKKLSWTMLDTVVWCAEMSATEAV